MILYALTFLLIWAVILLYFVARYNLKLRTIGAGVLSLTLFMLIFIFTFPRGITPGNISLPKSILVMHVLFSFLAYAAFALAFSAAVLYLLRERILKKKTVQALSSNFPSLEALENISFQLVVFGLFLLSTGIMAGMFWSKLSFNEFIRYVPKEIWSAATWVVYLNYVLIRILAQLSRHKRIYWLIGGSVLVMLVYFMVLK
jgi:ABC-type uncharacterized transport system permease subunit